MCIPGYRCPTDVILQSVRWYLRYRLSCRDLEEMLAERGVFVDHTTTFRWLTRFTPMLYAFKQRKAPVGRHSSAHSSLEVVDAIRKLARICIDTDEAARVTSIAMAYPLAVAIAGASNG